ncbi:MAG: hypothetical protein J6X30_01350, partial [Clostridia bacterium]|nr:hypothetical protein [Clostridia bacterium]
METLHEYKCPNCGGGITFNSQLQKMKCPFCDTEFEMEALRSFDQALKQEHPDDMQWDTKQNPTWTEEEETRLRTYVCDSCGGEIIGDETLAATACPYCGNPVIMMRQFAGILRPDLVIPFKLDKEAAKKNLLKHYEGKKLLPDVFKDQNHIDEIKGLYVPFWLYDADADANIRYRATRVHTWSDRDYIYTETQFYTVLRGGTLGFSAVPVDGSSKMPNDLMESLEPFDLSQAVDFQTAYLSGYLADKYDEDAEQCIPRANERVKHSTEDAFAA